MWRGADRSRRIVALLSAFVGAAAADELHYINMLVGDRASGMAGSYVAVADDPAGLYYNPAGIIYAPGSNLSASMNAYTLTRTVYNDVLGGQDWVRTSSSLLPNFFGVIQPLGLGVLGFSYAVPDSILEDQDQRFRAVPTDLGTADFTINFNNQDMVYNVGPSYAIALGKNGAIGLTLYGYQREQELIINQIFELQNGHHWENAYVHNEEYGIKPVFGAMWSPAKRLALGATISKTEIVYAKQFRQTACANSGSTCTADLLPFDINISDIRYDRVFPWTGTFGAAYFASSALLLSTQLSLYENLIDGGIPQWNAAAGAEYYITPRLALRGGAYSDRSNSAAIGASATNQLDHVDLYGGSISLTRFTRSSAISIGASGTLGQGSGQILANKTVVQSIDMASFSLFMSASYSY